MKTRMTKMFLTAMALLLLVVTLTSCGSEKEDTTAMPETIESKYAKAQQLLGTGQYVQAAEAFVALGNYEDASRMAVFCNACAAGEAGNYDDCISALENMSDLKDSKMRAAYYKARKLEDEGTYESLLKAESAYKDLPLYLDSNERRDAIHVKLYALAEESLASGVKVRARNIFLSLGDYRDSAERAEAIEVPHINSKIRDVRYLGEGLAAYKLDVEPKYREGLMNNNWELITEPIWLNIQRFTDGRTIATNYATSKFNILDTSGNILFEEFGVCELLSQGMAKYRERNVDSSWEYISPVGILKIVDPKSGFSTSYFEYASDFSPDGVAIVGKGNKNRKFGLLHKDGYYVIELIWSGLSNFSDGLALVKADSGLFGYIDTTGRIVIEPQWDYATSFSDGLAWVEKDYKYGFIDQNGNVVIELQWDDVKPFSEGLALVKKDNKYGFIDQNGNVVIETKWQSIKMINTNLFEILQSNNRGLIDASGNIITEPQWEKIEVLNDNLIMVWKSGRWGLIDMSGNIISEPQWEYPSTDKLNFSEGLAIFGKNGKYGYMDEAGNIVIEPTWIFAYPFENGLAIVGPKSDYSACIDRTGNMVVQPFAGRFFRFPDADNEYIMVIQENSRGDHQTTFLIDLHGNIVR